MATLLTIVRRSLANVLTFLGGLSRRTRSAGERTTRSLVVAPHPDDEVLGCGGTIAKKVIMGSPVRVVIVTDGRASHSSLIAADELVAIRREEALSAAQELGLTARDYEFLDFPDHDLASHRATAVARIRTIIGQFQPDEIYIPHRRDRLADHVATNEIVREALAGERRRIVVREYPVWLRNTWPWTVGRGGNGIGALRNLLDITHLTFFCRSQIDVRDVRERKQNALRAYRSQMERRNGAPDWPILADVSAGEWLACFRSDFESFDEWVHER